MNSLRGGCGELADDTGTSIRLRDELLAIEAFNTLMEARVLVEDWRIEYNTVRPHSALGYLTPTDYAKAWTTNHPALS
jgi:putative transposase